VKIIRVINAPEFTEQRVFEAKLRDLTKDQIDRLVDFMVRDPGHEEDPPLPLPGELPSGANSKH
jgi:hypothetical protein